MKIKRVECEQFAGVKDLAVEFSDGINLIIGDNESGKSTLADLIFRILFKDIKLDRRNSKDSEFIYQYFPQQVDGKGGDVIDGTLVFETVNGKYKLEKEWEVGTGSARLTQPDGTKNKKAKEIEGTLNEALEYREGVYDEIVFASQKRKQNAIETIMGNLVKKKDSKGGKDSDTEETRKNLTSTLTLVSLETGGVSIDKLESSLKTKLKELSNCWDFEADEPKDGKRKRGLSNKWRQNPGLILKAYYEMEEIRQKQSDAETAEKKVEEIQKKLRDAKDQSNKKSEELEKFRRVRGLLEQAALLRGAVKNEEQAILNMEHALEDWPQKLVKLNKAKELRTDEENIQIHERYLSIKRVKDAYDIAEEKKQELKEIKDDDLEAVLKAENKKQKAEGKLAGLNLIARIKQLGETPVEVSTVASGNSIEAHEDGYHISEAVDIRVPGVMQMQLIPQGVNVEQLKEDIRSADEIIQPIFERYGISSGKELKSCSDNYKKAVQDTDMAKRSLVFALNGESWEKIESENKTIVKLPDKRSVIEQTKELCQGRTLEQFIGRVEADLEYYNREYGSEEQLLSRKEKAEDEKTRMQGQLNAIVNIPEEFRKVDDPDGFEKKLINLNKGIQDTIDQYQNDLNTAVRNLKDKTAEEYTEELISLESIFESKKQEYKHYNHIYEAFCELKAKIKGNPIEDIEEKFKDYLSVITDGGLELRDMDEKMNVVLSSGRHKLSYDILSNGTKDTISLAFRLAMLEHLYPDGDGLAVFDDAFTEMDPKRVKQACRLIEKFAENNQVIFITCDAKYRELLPKGKVIEMTS